LGLIKPEVASSRDTWGAKLNQNFDILDAVGISAAVISDDPPLSPTAGQMWWESDTGNLYIWYADVDSSQWVHVTGPVGAQGPQGPMGSVGPQGPTGEQGERGAMLLTGEGPPLAGLGVIGDTYIDITNGQIWSNPAGVWTDTGENIFGTIPADAEADAARAEAAANAAQNAQAAAESARDTSFTYGPKYPDEATGRAAVADGAYFMVIGTGDVAAHEYRRINAGSSTYVTSYPSANATIAADERGSYARFAEERASRNDGRPRALVLILVGQSGNTSRGTNISGVVSADAFMPVGGNAMPEMDFFAANNEHSIYWTDVASVVTHAEGVGESPISGIITTVMGNYFQRIYACSVAVGARTLDVLSTIGPRCNLYALTHRLCDIARADGYQPMVAFDMHHGEADMVGAPTEADYLSDALFYYGMCQAVAAQAMEKPDYLAPIVIHNPIEMKDGTDGAGSRVIHSAIRRMAKTAPQSIFAGGCYHFESNTDRVHQSDAGYRMRGEQVGHLLRKHFEGGVREHALEVVDVRWSGTTATVLFSEDVVLDTSYDWGTSLNTSFARNGFEWEDNGVLVPVTAVTVQGRKVVLTLGSAPVGTAAQQKLRIASQTTTSGLVAAIGSLRSGSQIRVNEPGRSSIYQYGDPSYGIHYRWAIPQLCDVRAA